MNARVYVYVYVRAREREERKDERSVGKNGARGYATKCNASEKERVNECQIHRWDDEDRTSRE